MRRLLALLAAVLLAAPARAAAAPAAPAAPAASAASAASQDQLLALLADQYWDMQMRLSPLSATYNGYPEYNDGLDDIGAAGRAEDLRSSKAMLERLLAVDRGRLSQANRVSYDVMKLELERRIERHKYKLWQWDVDPIDGGQTRIPTVVAQAQPMKTAQDAENYLVRLKTLPAYFAEREANLREGLAEGRVAARMPVVRLIDQLDGLISTPAEKSPFAQAADRLPPDLKARYGPRILEAVSTHVVPSYAEYRRFLKEEYLPKARTGGSIGLSGLSGGRAAYDYLIRYHTTTDYSPDKINKLGLDELKSIDKQLKKLAKRMGHKGDVKSFLQSVRSDPKNFFQTREQVLQSAEDSVAEAKTKLPLYFGRLPRTPLVVKPLEAYKEKNDAAARYDEPPDDLSRPGVCSINTYKPETRARFDMVSLAAHEGVPGHHMQLALQVENRALPAFRRHGDFNAFTEGWALYAEQLADELGLYPDDLSRVGFLSDQALGASRLVVDTGIHAFGWPREQAIEFLRDHTALSEPEIEAEVDRETARPGQALSAMIGERQILDLRKEAQKKLGRGFDIRAFHDKVLENGALPLPILRRLVLGEPDKTAAAGPYGEP